MNPNDVYDTLVCSTMYDPTCLELVALFVVFAGFGLAALVSYDSRPLHLVVPFV